MATTNGYDFEMETPMPMKHPQFLGGQPSMNGKPIFDFQLERMKLQAG